MVFCVKQMKKKKVCIEINRPRQYPRRSVLIYSFSVFLQDIFLSFLPCSLFFLYHPPPSLIPTPHVYTGGLVLILVTSVPPISLHVVAVRLKHTVQVSPPH